MVFIRLAEGSGSAGAALGTGMTAMDAFVNPASARAREELQHQNERVMPAPSPGDRLLREGRIIITVDDAP